MYILIFLLLILLVASFVVAYYASRTWHWGYVVVMLGIFLSTVGYFILAAAVLEYQRNWRNRANEFRDQIARTDAQNDALQRGTQDPMLIGQLRAEEVRIADDAEELPSLEDLDHQLRLAVRSRGRVWRNVAPLGFDPQTGELQIGVETPRPAGIAAETIVYLFEQGPPALPDPAQGAQYLGEFHVRQSAGQEATLLPVLPLDDFERQRIAAGRVPWILYETMPADRHELFARMSDERLRQIIPEQSLEEYLRHGQPAGPDDPDERRAGFDEEGDRLGPDEMDRAVTERYDRRLRDYALEFEQLARERTVLLADAAAARQDNERLAAALEGAQKLQAFRQEERRRLGIDLAGIERERQAIDQHLGRLQQQLDTARQRLEETLRQNSQLAQQLASQQQQALEAAPPQPLALVEQ